jgi:hypothetical protein
MAHACPPKAIVVAAAAFLCLLSTGPWTAAAQGVASGFLALPPAPPKTLELQRQLSTINALLVKPLENGDHAGTVSKLTATVVASNSPKMTVAFNQAVGPDMSLALREVIRGVQLKYQAWPDAATLQFGFDNKWIGKDGPSAAVACAVLLESLIQGFEINPEIALTGDLNADGNVRPVGGIDAKIRAALEEGCRIVGIPAANETDAFDMILDEGYSKFVQGQIFTLRTLPDALLLASPKDQPEATEALASFDTIIQDLRARRVALADAGTTERLLAVGRTLPNHLSAKVLLLAAQNRLPRRYSLKGRFLRLQQTYVSFQATILKIRQEGGKLSESKLANDAFTKVVASLTRLRNYSDPRLETYLNSINDFVRAMRNAMRGESAGLAEQKTLVEAFQRAAERVELEEKKIKEDKTINDELMHED